MHPSQKEEQITLKQTNHTHTHTHTQSEKPKKKTNKTKWKNKQTNPTALMFIALETAAFASGRVMWSLSRGKTVEGTAEQLYEKCG